MRTWRVTNLEKARATGRASYYRNRDTAKARMALWRAEHRDEKRVASAAYHSDHRDTENEKARLRYVNNRDLFAHYSATRRARKSGNGGSHTFAEWREKLELFAYCCAYCGESKPLTRDHKTPLSRGGTDDIMNIVPACLPCNLRKHARTSQEFLSLRIA